MTKPITWPVIMWTTVGNPPTPMNEILNPVTQIITQSLRNRDTNILIQTTPNILTTLVSQPAVLMATATCPTGKVLSHFWHRHPPLAVCAYLSITRANSLSVLQTVACLTLFKIQNMELQAVCLKIFWCWRISNDLWKPFKFGPFVASTAPQVVSISATGTIGCKKN